MCSLLFRAVSTEQDTDGRAPTLPVLACYSDEENMEGAHTVSPPRWQRSGYTPLVLTSTILPNVGNNILIFNVLSIWTF